MATYLPPGPGIVQAALCEKMQYQADAILDMLDNFQDLFYHSLGYLKDFLKTMSWSPPSEVIDKINQIDNKAADLIPDVTDFDRLIDMLNSCAFLQKTGDASTLVRQTTGPFLDNAATAIDGITESMPEFDAVSLFNELTSHIKTKKIDTSVLDLQDALACLYHICGVDIQSRLDHLNSFLSSCNMNGSGELDVDQVLYSSGITDPAKQAAFKKAKTAVKNIYNSIEDKILDGVERINILTEDNPLY